jgi:hypothetical protein
LSLPAASSCPDASILAEEAGFDKKIVSALKGLFSLHLPTPNIFLSLFPFSGKSISDVAGFSSEDLEGLGIR